jgi:hypothetical protein
MTRLWRLWERYWFRPAPLVDLAVVRLVAVGFWLYHLARIRPRGVFGPLAALPDAMYEPLVVVRVMTLPLAWHYRPSEEVVLGVYWVTLAVGVLAFIGYRTNLSLLLFAIGSIFLQGYRYSFHEIHHSEAIVMITLGLLALAPSGGALSVDDLRRRLRAADRGLAVPRDPLAGESRFARWPLLVVQWTFALIYMSAAYHKLTTGGLDWMNGWTLQYYMLQDGLRWGSSLGVWLGQHHTIALLASWGSILFEATFWLVLLVPALALVYLPVGLGFHLGIYLIQRAPFFSFMWLYAVFVPWREIFRRAGAFLVARTGRPVLRYDPASPRSVRRATVVRYFDWLGLVALEPVAPRAEGAPATVRP